MLLKSSIIAIGCADVCFRMYSMQLVTLVKQELSSRSLALEHEAQGGRTV